MFKLTLLFAIALVFVAYSSASLDTGKFSFPYTAPSNTCSISLGCAKSGDTCVGDFSSKGCNMTSANSTCCGQGLFCVNSTCTGNTMGEWCNNITDCKGGGMFVKCLNNTCTQLGMPGDGCSDESPCYFGTSTCNNDSICTGVQAGGSCALSVYQCDVGFYCAKNLTCQPLIATNGTCSPTLAASQQVCANGNICGSNKICIPPFGGNNGTVCSSNIECASDFACDFHTFKCSTATEWSKTSCSADSDCSSTEYCACSQVTGEQFCVPTAFYLDDSCTDNSQSFLTCASENNCSSYYFYNSMNVLPDDSCVAQNCKSDYKKAYACGCDLNKDSYGNCNYNPYCGGFPLWAIIVIAIVGVIIVLVIIIIIVMVMRRRRTYDTIA